MKLWQNLPQIIIPVVFALFALFFFPFNSDFSEWNRAFLLFTAVALCLFWGFVRLGQKKQFTLITSSFNLPVLLFMMSFVVSTLFAPAKISGLLSPLGTGIIIVLSIWYIVVSNSLNEKWFKILPQILLTIGSFFSFIIILLFLNTAFKLLPSVIPNWHTSVILNLFQDPDSGQARMTSLESFTFLFPLLLISGYSLWQYFKTRDYSSSASEKFSRSLPRAQPKDANSIFLTLVSFFLLLIATILVLPLPSFTSPLPSPARRGDTRGEVYKGEVSLPYSSAWSVALDTLKQPKTAFLGYGVGNFSVALALNRPLSLNTLDQDRYAGVNFPRSSNFPFQLLTENGILGLLAFLYLLLLVFKKSKNTFIRWVASVEVGKFSRSRSELVEDFDAAKNFRQRDDRQDPSGFALLGFWSTVLFLFLFPPNLTLWLYFFTFLGLIVSSESHLGGVKAKTYDLANLENSVWAVSLTLIFLISLIVFLAGRAYSAEFNYQQALSGIAKNAKVGPVYNLLKSAADLNPFLPKYHMALSQTMLFWGTGLTKKDNVTDKDRSDATTLVQQAISQAQSAIALNPQDAAAWENLGQIYQSLSSAVNGADSWTISSLTQAVALDPNSPQSHFVLSGAYIALSQWQNAQKQLEISVALSPHFANGLYNLSYVQKQQGLYKEALNSLNQAISLLPDNADKQKAVSEKTALEKLVGTSGPSTVNPAPSVELSPKLNLPESSSPPAHFKP